MPGEREHVNKKQTARGRRAYYNKNPSSLFSNIILRIRIILGKAITQP